MRWRKNNKIFIPDKIREIYSQSSLKEAWL